MFDIYMQIFAKYRFLDCWITGWVYFILMDTAIFFWKTILVYINCWNSLEKPSNSQRDPFLSVSSHSLLALNLNVYIYKIWIYFVFLTKFCLWFLSFTLPIYWYEHFPLSFVFNFVSVLSFQWNLEMWDWTHFDIWINLMFITICLHYFYAGTVQALRIER